MNKTANLGVIFFLFLLTGAAYWEVITFDFINFDDPVYITGNTQIQKGLTLENLKWAITATYASNWHPLTWVSHMADIELFGLNPGGHHLTSLLLHSINSILLFFVIKYLTGALFPGAFLAFLFALHPLHVESVAWVSERKDLLSTFFWFWTLIFYSFYVKKTDFKRYLPVFFSFCLGIISKPMVVTLPFTLLLLDYWPLNRYGDTTNFRNTFIRCIWEKIPLFALSIFSCLITYYAQKMGEEVSSFDSLPLYLRFFNALNSYQVYLLKMIIPTALAPYYPYETISWFKALSAVVTLLIISAITIKFKKRYPFMLIGWLWYLGTLVPVIGFIQVGKQSMADRYTYIPLLGLFLIIAFFAAGFTGRQKKIVTSLAICFILVLAGITKKQVGYWQNSITLFTHSVKVTENNYLSYNNLGVALTEKKELKEGEFNYERGIQINPKFAPLHFNLGVNLAEQKKYEEAIIHFQNAVQLDPYSADSLLNLGSLLNQQGKTDEAIRYFEQTLKIKPNSFEANNNMANGLLKKGKIDDAIFFYNKALELNPYSEKVYFHLGIAMLNKGDKKKSIENYNKALSINPKSEDVLNNLGGLMMEMENFVEAENYYKRGMKFYPNSDKWHVNLGILYAKKGNLDNAISHYKEAIRLNGKSVSALYNLGVTYFLQNNMIKAMEHYKEAINIDPTYGDAHFNIGVLLANQGDLNNALNHFNQALNTQPLNAELYRNIGLVLFQLGKLTEAVEKFSKALEINPEYKEADTLLKNTLKEIEKK